MKMPKTVIGVLRCLTSRGCKKRYSDYSPPMNKALFSISLFGLGLILGTLGDFSHVGTGTIVYGPDVTVIPNLNIGWWAPFLFGSACLIWGWFIRLTSKNVPKRPASGALIFWSLTFFLFVYIASGLLPLQPNSMAEFQAVCFFGFWFFTNRTKYGLWVSAVNGICGCLFEITLSYFEKFFYLPPNNQFSGIPFWLFFLYCSAGVSMIPVVRKLESIFSEKL